MKKGLWVSPTEFRNFAAVDTTRSLSDEIATRQRSIDFYSLGMYLPNPDPVLKKMGKDITVYKELLGDAHVQGCVTSRKAGVKKLLWEIDRGKAKSRQAKFISDALKDIDVDQVIGEILNAPLYGYQVLEVLWTVGENMIVPNAIIGKPQQWFVFSDTNELRFRTKSNYANGEPLPDKKFLLARHDASYENPYGFPVLSCCFWPVTFRKGGFKFWVTFTEKFGMPFIIGKLPRGTGETEKNNLADMLERMIQDAIAVVPDDASIEIPEMKHAASPDIYGKLIDTCKSEISIAVLGQNLTTEVKGGSYAATQGHMEVRADIVDGDRKIPERVINTLIKWIAEYNFSERVELPVFTMYEEENVDLAQATRDKTLSDTGQVRYTKEYFMRTYGFEEGDINVVDPQPPTPFLPSQAKNFSAPQVKSFPDQLAIDDAVNSLDPAVLQKQMEGILKPVIDLINKGSSHEEIMAQLVSAYPDMNTDALELMLARAIFVCEVWGRLTAGSK